VGFSFGGVQPLAGSHCSFTANTVMSRMPARNAGTATPTCERAERARPLGRRWRSAISVPNGTAMTTASTIAQTTSHMVTCSRSTICGAISALDT
jgi:hypothetical protein